MPPIPPITWLIVLAPAILLTAGLSVTAPTATVVRRCQRAATAAVIVALAACGARLADIGGSAPWMLTGPMGLTLYVDALAGVMLTLVAFIGFVVVRFAAGYLAGDPRHGYFMRWLCLTLASVLLLVVSGNLVQFAAAWVATSLCLHRLLVFHGDRPRAVRAARKKQVVSRLGDASLVSAIVLIQQQFGSLRFDHLLHAPTADGPAATAIALLLVASALLKSAQFPLHGWLTEVMETPTPVSALLHAGIINAGGFLVLRLGHLVADVPVALDTLAFVGGFTALFGSAVMLTQNSIKVALAWSTIAQMGFMFLECGLGAFSAAALHLVAHSLYKAHAFLSSGSVVEVKRSVAVPPAVERPHPVLLALAIGAALVGAWAVGALLFGASLTAAPGVFALAGVLVMGVAHLVVHAAAERAGAAVFVRAALAAAGVAALYFALQAGTARVLDGAIPPDLPAREPIDLLAVLLVLMSFGAVMVVQGLVPHETRHPRWRALYVHLRNGLYVDTLAHRLLDRLLTPVPRNRTEEA